jgi:hypothetical protein
MQVVMGVPAVAGVPAAEVLVDTPVPAEAVVERVPADLTAVFFRVGIIAFAFIARMVPAADPTVGKDQVADPTVGMVRVVDLTVGTERIEAGPVVARVVALFTRTSKKVA